MAVRNLRLKDDSSLEEIQNELSYGYHRSQQLLESVQMVPEIPGELEKSEIIIDDKKAFYYPRKEGYKVFEVKVKLKNKITLTTSTQMHDRQYRGRHYIHCWVPKNEKQKIRTDFIAHLKKKTKPKERRNPPLRKIGTIYHEPGTFLAAPNVYNCDIEEKGSDNSKDDSNEKGKSLDQGQVKNGVKKQKSKRKRKLNFSGTKELNKSTISAFGQSEQDISNTNDYSVINYSSYLMPNANDVSFYGSNNEASVKHSSCISHTMTETGNTLINNYKVINTIGRGSFGKVVRVLDIKDRSYYALKTLKKSRMKLKVSLSLGTANGYDVLNEINIIKKMVNFFLFLEPPQYCQSS